MAYLRAKMSRFITQNMTGLFAFLQHWRKQFFWFDDFIRFVWATTKCNYHQRSTI